MRTTIALDDELVAKAQAFTGLKEKSSLVREALFDDGNEDVDRHGDPDLRFDGVFGGAEERLDAQVLLDPFEEQFHLPAVFCKAWRW